MLRSCKDSCSWQQDEGCPAKQYVIGFMREGSMHVGQWSAIPLTPRHRAARRRWAAEHRDWEQHDWCQVLFTDESRFSLECDARRVPVWRDRGTRNNPAFVRERSQYRRAGWMVWGGVSIGGRTDLHIIRNDTLTGRRYADEILRPHVIPYAGAIGDSFVFQDDNARAHRARLVENMLEAETIQRTECPVSSPDLNPIEHVWDMLGRRIAARPRPPATVRDLEISLLEEWNSIPQSLIDNLIASMANSRFSRTFSSTNLSGYFTTVFDKRALPCEKTTMFANEQYYLSQRSALSWSRSTGGPSRHFEVTALNNI
ncbi:transposable element Tcb2 transposase [Trichonephila clavipes]|uniref:Transposable element Tcb2 transposase n=1 Tax=Trichonephila clavipes TaxID=2585209 RepID=A0A8X6RPT3_TRICX|nr:transposable element Tcb2 transposase [Trichonephila clavipes]